ncbi:MAG TPA: hypothetical protein VIC08_12335 [Cellvibrionaceae bacterium]
MSKKSSVSPTLLLLETPQEFTEQTLAAIDNARRSIRILSDKLDPMVYNQDQIVTALSAFVRQNRCAQLQILVRHSDDMIERGHRLNALIRRLPSKVVLRKITLEPANQHMAFLLADNRTLIYKNDDSYHAGFSDTNAPAEVKSLYEVFGQCWETAIEEPRLRVLHL